MKVALYLRMSTDKQDTSIPQQRVELERYAERHGYKIVHEYRDEGTRPCGRAWTCSR